MREILCCLPSWFSVRIPSKRKPKNPHITGSLTGLSFGEIISRRRQRASRVRDWGRARLRAIGVIPDIKDVMRFCICVSLTEAWIKNNRKNNTNP